VAWSFWLSQSDDCWIHIPIQPILETELPEQRPLRLALIVTNPIKDLINSFSSWLKLIRAVGWIAKFIKYIASKGRRPTVKYLTVQNIKAASRSSSQVESITKDSSREQIHQESWLQTPHVEMIPTICHT